MTILLITNTEDVTTDFVVKELSRRNLLFFRLNTDQLFSQVNVTFLVDKGTFVIEDIKSNRFVDLSEVKCVFYRRPELPRLTGMELTEQEHRFIAGELLFFLEGFYKALDNAFWFNDVFKIREAENKIYQLQLAKKLGFLIPQTIISNSVAEIDLFIDENNKDCIIKPLKSGLMDGDPQKVVFTSRLNQNVIGDIRLSLFPNFIQKAISKVCDIRVTIVGQKIFAAEITTSNLNSLDIDWRVVSPEFLVYRAITLPKEIEEKCLALVQKLGLNFSAIDLVCDKSGDYYFLEINPNGQWAWIEKRLNLAISKSIVDIIEHESTLQHS